MANLDLATLLVRIEADAKQALTEMEKVGSSSKKQAESVGADWSKAGKQLTDIGGKLTKAITLPLVAAMGAAVKLASDLTETLGKTDVVFGDLSDKVISWSENSVESMGMAQQTALDMASTFGDLATSMGLSTAESASMSMELTQLAADMASFKNISVDRANTALQAVFTGETESLKAMGVVMTEANLQQFAMNEGITTTYQEMSQAEKVMLRYRYVMAATSNAQGDFQRTGDSLANQSRKLMENVKQLGASFGSILEPAITSIVQAINGFITWLNNLDEGTKRTILTVAEVLAVVPLVIAAIGGIITVIGHLQTALTALMANPVTIWIMAIAAAVAALAVILMNVKASIDEYNKAVIAMKDKETKVTTSYETLIQVMEDENETVEDVLGDIATAIQTARDAGELIAAIKALPPQAREVDAVVNAINALLKTREAYCEIAGIKKENDPVWNELQNLKATVEISGVSNDTLNAIATTVDELEADLIVIDTKYKNLEILISVNNQDKEGLLKDIVADCATIAGLDPTIDMVFTSTGFEDLDSITQALGTAIISTGDWGEKVKTITEEIDGWLEKQKKQVQNALALQAIYLAIAYNAETISQAEYYAGMEAIQEQYTSLSQSIEETGEAAKTTAELLNNGLGGADDYDAFAASINGVSTELGGMTGIIDANATAQERFATASGQMAEATLKGADNTASMAGQLVVANTAVDEMTGTMESAINGALTNYESKVVDIANTEQEQIAAIDENIAKKQEEQDALSTYASFLDANNGDVVAAYDELKEMYPELAEIVLTYYGDAETLALQTSATIREAENTSAYEAIVLEQTKGDEIVRIQTEANAAREQLEKDTITELGSITSGYTIEELTRYAQYYSSIGAQDTADKLYRLTGLQGYCDKAAAQTAEGNYNLLELNKGYIDDVEALDTSAYAAGEKVGDQLGEGMYDGVDGWGKRIADKAAQIVKDAVKAAKTEGDIKSPSRKMRDEIGKPLAQGIEVGMEEYFPNVLKSVKANIGSIVSGASAAMPKTTAATANTTNIARQGDTVINQNNTFTSRTLTPYEQQQQIRKLNKGLSEVFA